MTTKPPAHLLEPIAEHPDLGPIYRGDWIYSESQHEWLLVERSDGKVIYATSDRFSYHLPMHAITAIYRPGQEEAAKKLDRFINFCPKWMPGPHNHLFVNDTETTTLVEQPEPQRPPLSECSAEDIARYYKGVKLCHPNMLLTKFVVPTGEKKGGMGFVATTYFRSGDTKGQDIRLSSADWQLYEEPTGPTVDEMKRMARLGVGR